MYGCFVDERSPGRSWPGLGAYHSSLAFRRACEAEESLRVDSRQLFEYPSFSTRAPTGPRKFDIKGQEELERVWKWKGGSGKTHCVSFRSKGVNASSCRVKEKFKVFIFIFIYLCTSPAQVNREIYEFVASCISMSNT